MTQGEWKNIFGDNLADLLEEKGMSQNKLAKDSKVSMGAISDYINKFTAPSVFSIINMAYALDVDIDELVDFGDRITNYK